MGRSNGGPMTGEVEHTVYAHAPYSSMYVHVFLGLACSVCVYVCNCWLHDVPTQEYVVRATDPELL